MKWVGIILIVLLNIAFVDGLIINEIMYNPAGTDSGREWVEIYNEGLTLNITDYIFSEGGKDHSINEYQGGMIIPAGAYAIIADDPELFLQEYFFLGIIFDSSWVSLSNTGELIQIKDKDNNIIDSVEYSNEWGGGSNVSLGLINGVWNSSKPTPGQMNGNSCGGVRKQVCSNGIWVNDGGCSSKGKSCGEVDCDYLDTPCRDYKDVNNLCNSEGMCDQTACDDYEEKEGACGASEEFGCPWGNESGSDVGVKVLSGMCNKGECVLSGEWEVFEECSEGQACGLVGGEYGCVCEPMPEVCDGIDNDCDGEVDESLIRQVSCEASFAPIATGVAFAGGLGGFLFMRRVF